MLGSIDSYPTTLFTDRACWRQPVSDKEIHYWSQRDILIENKFFFANDPELTAQDVLEVTSAAGSTERYEVLETSTPDDSAGLGMLYRVLCQRLET